MAQAATLVEGFLAHFGHAVTIDVWRYDETRLLFAARVEPDNFHIVFIHNAERKPKLMYCHNSDALI